MQKWIKELLIYSVIIILVILIRQFLVVPIQVDGPSMEPTLKEGQIMLLNKFAYRFDKPRRFDIVVINENGVPIIKRIIGLPGDTVKIVGNQLFINEKIVKQPFKHQKMSDYQLKQTIAKENYFVLGDNRPLSQDSRIIGLISKKDLMGKVNLSLWPMRQY